MKNLFFGGSSEISIKLAQISQDIYNISRKRNKKFKKNFILKDYSETELSKKLKLLKRTKFDNIMIFNGIFGQSFLSNYSHKEFRKILNINLEIPLLISSLCISEKILNKNGCIYFVSSLASTKPEIGNAYYALSKNALNYASQILNMEQKKRCIRFNSILLGLIESKMSDKLINSIPLIKKKELKFTNLDKVKKRIKNLFEDNNINGKIIKI